MEEKLGDASAYESFVRTSIAKHKFRFYQRFGSKIIDEIGPPKYRSKIGTSFKQK